MKRIIISMICAASAVAASAQTIQDVAAQAAMAVAEADQVEAVVEKPQYWSTDLKTQINV